MGLATDLERTYIGLATNASCGAEPFKKIVTMTRKFIPKNCIFKTQRRRGAKIILEHEKHKTNEIFSLFCVFRVQTKYP